MPLSLCIPQAITLAKDRRPALVVSTLSPIIGTPLFQPPKYLPYRLLPCSCSFKINKDYFITYLLTATNLAIHSAYNPTPISNYLFLYHALFFLPSSILLAQQSTIHPFLQI